MNGIKIMFVGIMMVTSLPALGASMCMLPPGSSTSNQPSENADNNRGFWTVGNTIVGESHCSTLGIITPDNYTQFETNGGNCWCRVTQVAAPNGYMARRSGAWVYRDYDGTSSCASTCAHNCANYVRSWTGFRRAMMSSQRPLDTP